MSTTASARIPFSSRSASATSSNVSKPYRALSTGSPDARRDQSLILHDGRTLGYAEFGPSTGYPLFFFHGYPSSRLEGFGLERLAYRRNIRVISPDRPGFGLSSFQPARTLNSWPADIEGLADHLKLEKFAILGASGGGPYAMACIHALSKDRLSAVGLMSSSGPWEGGTRDVPWFGRLTALLANRFPSGTRILFDTIVGVAKWVTSTRFVSNIMDQALAKEREKAHAVMRQKGEEIDDTVPVEIRREQVLSTVFESFAQGSAGAVQEAQILSKPWDIPFEDVVYDKIQLWHGTKDVNAPISLIRYLTKRLPHAQLREFEGEDHFTLLRHLDEILEELIPDSRTSH